MVARTHAQRYANPKRFMSITISRLHIIINMTTTTIYFGEDETDMATYCLDALSLSGAFETSRLLTPNYTVLEIRSASPCHQKIIARIVGDAITCFYKFGVLKTLDSGSLTGSYAHYALIGALLSVDIDDERKSIANKVSKLSEIAPKSLLELRLRNLITSWEGLKTLTEVILKQSVGKDDFYELVSYFIAGDKTMPKVTVTEGESIGIEVDGVPRAIPSLTGNRDLDVLLSVVRERPAHIVIRKKEALSDELLAALRDLGEDQ